MNIPQVIPQAVQTMSSREIAELTEDIASGVASHEDATQSALALIAHAASLFASCRNDQIEKMSRADAIEALNRIEGGRKNLRQVASMFQQYPVVEKCVDDLITVFRYAEALIIPAYLLGNKDCIDNNNASISTYLVLHPDTGKVKIGKSARVEDRIKSLQTGSGSELFVLSILAGDREKELHAKFGKYRTYGEWFDDVDGEITAFIAGEDLAKLAVTIGIKGTEFIRQLADDGVIFKRGGSWVPYQAHVDSGRFTVNTGEANGHAFLQTRVEPKGVEWLARRYGGAE